MIRTLNLFASGFVCFAGGVIPQRDLPVESRRYNFLPSNSPMEAVAGDVLRTGAQIRLAQREHEMLRQAEFNFAS